MGRQSFKRFLTSDDFFNSGSLQVTWYNANGKRRVDDVGDGRQEDVKVFIKKHGGNGIVFTRLGGCTVDYF